ncbi:MAG: hypothetical protein AB1758_28105 [Candidatus Eremiobacterota bacterium]
MDLSRAIPIPVGVREVSCPRGAAAPPTSWELADASPLVEAGLRPTAAQLDQMGARFFERLQRLATASFTARAQDDLVRLQADPELHRVLVGALALALLSREELFAGSVSLPPRLRADLRDHLFAILEDRDSEHRALAARLLASRDLAANRYEVLAVEEQLAFYRHDPALSAAVEGSLVALTAGGGPPLAALEAREKLVVPRSDRTRPADLLYEQAQRWLHAGRTSRQVVPDLSPRLGALAELLAGLNELCQADGSLRRHRYFLITTLEELFEACDACLEGRPGRTEHTLHHLRPYEELGVWRKRSVLRPGADPSLEDQQEESRFFVDLARLGARVAPSRIAVCRLWNLDGVPLERIEEHLSSFKTNRPVEATDLELFEMHRMRFRPLIPA